MSQPTPSDETILEVPLTTDEPILAVGAELKSAPALMAGSSVYVGEAIGRLDQPNHYRRFLAQIETLQQRHDLRANVIAYDLHPEYAATRYARSLPGRHIGVQHHHAHIAACMAEHGLTGQAVGLACDGTGYGTDGTIWGCEVLACDFDAGAFERAGYLRPFPLLGGDAAAIETYRPALGVLAETFGSNWPDAVKAITARIDPQALALAQRRLASPLARLPRTSSLGRFFDAAAFLLGLCDRNKTEAQAPIALQQAAERCDAVESWNYAIEQDNHGAMVMDPRPMVRAMVNESREQADDSLDTLARKFHETLAAMLTETARRVCETINENRVILTGGCFLNGLLRTAVEERLCRTGLEVYTHRRLSPGDESIALGQAVIAAARLKKGTR